MNTGTLAHDFGLNRVSILECFRRVAASKVDMYWSTDTKLSSPPRSVKTKEFALIVQAQGQCLIQGCPRYNTTLT